MPSRALATWKEQFTFRDEAERDFDHLPPETREAFLNIFPEFALRPWKATATMDVAPLRDMPGRWRLKVAGGHRGIYREVQGRPEFEMFETRDQVYSRLRKYLESK